MRPILVLILTLGLFAVKAEAQLEKHQATLIVGFTKHVEWPALERQHTFRIGVLGNDHPIYKELIAASLNQLVMGKDIEVVEFSTVSDLTACHILFIPNGRLGHLRRAANTLLGIPVLIVTESQDTLPHESVINISIENDRMGYKVNARRLEDRGLTVSRQLLNSSR
jgi:hypothetical protein